MKTMGLTVGDGMTVRAFALNEETGEKTNLDVFQYSAICERGFEEYLSDSAKDMFDEETGEMTTYKRQTTFYADLSIGEWYGEKGIRDTFDNAFKYWINDKVYFTEFIMALNIKLHNWYKMGCEPMARLYDELWGKADSAFIEKHKDNKEFMEYFYHVTD